MAPLRCSIIIPTFNRAGFLSKAIESVLRQMLAGDELIIVDDGSDDDTLEVLDRYRDQITVIRLPRVGAGKARNIGISRAKNELVAFLDSDDYWFPFKLELQRAFMQQRPDLLFCFTNFEVQLRDGSVRSRYLELWPRNHANLEDAFGPGYPYSTITPPPQGVSDFMVYEGDLYRLQLTGLYVLTDTLVARREEAGEALSFSEDLTTHVDLECFYKLSRKGKSAFLDIETVRQLDHPEGRLSQSHILKIVDARLTLTRRIWGADEAFLADNEDAYRLRVEELLLQKAKLQLADGQNAGARTTVKEMCFPPAWLRVLTRVPGWITRIGISFRRTMKRDN